MEVNKIIQRVEQDGSIIYLSIYPSTHPSIHQMGGGREACDRNGGKISRELESIQETH